MLSLSLVTEALTGLIYHRPSGENSNIPFHWIINEYEKSYQKLAFVFDHDIKTFEGYKNVLISWSNTPARFWYITSYPTWYILLFLEIIISKRPQLQLLMEISNSFQTSRHEFHCKFSPFTKFINPCIGIYMETTTHFLKNEILSWI